MGKYALTEQEGCGDWCRMRMAHLQAEQEMDNGKNA